MNAVRTAARDSMGLEPFELVRADGNAAPQWLADELARNVKFVTEAIENADMAADMARTWARGSFTGRNNIREAVDAWIAHQWEFHDGDPILILNVWQSLDREARA